MKPLEGDVEHIRCVFLEASCHSVTILGRRIGQENRFCRTTQRSFIVKR